LAAGDARAGFDAVKSRLAQETVDRRAYWMAPDIALQKQQPRAFALPGFDEYLLGYKDRSLMLAEEHKNAIIPGGNGVFQSTIVRAGRVIGVWKRTLGAKRIDVTMLPLVPLTATERARVEEALEPYARFIGKPTRITWP
jgi:hypothetical protein